MSSSFFAYLSRMKLIRRWSLMRNTQSENIAEHSHQVAVIAHGLAVAGNRYFGRQLDPGKVALLAIYHDAAEVIIGDLPTPVKYFNPEIKTSYGRIEDVAGDKLLSFLPAELKEDFFPYFFPDREDYAARLVKAADKLSAYVKCLEETAAGNREFIKARDAIGAELDEYRKLPEVDWFMEHCLEPFTKTLDELG